MNIRERVLQIRDEMQALTNEYTDLMTKHAWGLTDTEQSLGISDNVVVFPTGERLQ